MVQFQCMNASSSSSSGVGSYNEMASILLVPGQQSLTNLYRRGVYDLFGTPGKSKTRFNCSWRFFLSPNLPSSSLLVFLL
jgi:hypothetical protein